jgi:hypothetical protein
MTEWALVADVDIESERCRPCLGGLRFTIEAVIKIARMKSYPATLRFLPASSEVFAGSVLSNPDQLPPSESPFLQSCGAGPSRSSASASWMELRDSFVLFAACKSRYAAADMLRKKFDCL